MTTTFYLEGGRFLLDDGKFAISSDCCCQFTCPDRPAETCSGCSPAIPNKLKITVSGLSGVHVGCDCDVTNGVWGLCRGENPSTPTWQNDCRWWSEYITCSPTQSKAILIQWFDELVIGNIKYFPDHWRYSDGSCELINDTSGSCDPTGIYKFPPLDDPNYGDRELFPICNCSGDDRIAVVSHA